MCSIRLFPIMAKGWRGYLEEESEFQWIAMAGFFIFILLGAIAIQGTSNLPGVEVGANNALASSTSPTPPMMHSRQGSSPQTGLNSISNLTATLPSRSSAPPTESAQTTSSS